MIIPTAAQQYIDAATQLIQQANGGQAIQLCPVPRHLLAVPTIEAYTTVCLAAACRYYDILPAQATLRTRKGPAVAARQTVVYAMCHVLGLDAAQLKKPMGFLHAANARYAHQQADNRYTTEKHFKHGADMVCIALTEHLKLHCHPDQPETLNPQP